MHATVRQRTAQPAWLTANFVDDCDTREAATTRTTHPAYRYDTRLAGAMNAPGLARQEELLDRTKAERAADSVVRPFQLFAQRQASGGLVLLGFAIVALAWANSPWAWAYRQMLDLPLAISLG